MPSMTRKMLKDTVNCLIFPHAAKKFSTFFLSYQQTQVRLIQRFEIFNYLSKSIAFVAKFYFFLQSKRRFPHKTEFSTLTVENSVLGRRKNVDNVENFREFSTLSTGFPHEKGSFPHFLFAMRLLLYNRFYNVDGLSKPMVLVTFFYFAVRSKRTFPHFPHTLLLLLL